MFFLKRRAVLKDFFTLFIKIVFASFFLLVGIFIFFLFYKLISLFDWEVFKSIFANFRWNITEKKYSVYPFLIFTFFLVFMLLLFLLPITIMISIFVCYFFSPPARRIILLFFKIFIGMPSIIIGVVCHRLFTNIFPQNDGYNFFNTLLTLLLMTLPIMLFFVLPEFEKAYLKYKNIFLILNIKEHVFLFKITSFIKKSIFLGTIFVFTRIIGETMAIILVSIPADKLKTLVFDLKSLFSSEYFLSLAGIIGLNIANKDIINKDLEFVLYVFLFLLLLIVFLFSFFGNKLIQKRTFFLNRNKFKNDNFFFRTSFFWKINKKKEYKKNYRENFFYLKFIIFIVIATLVFLFVVAIFFGFFSQILMKIDWINFFSIFRQNETMIVLKNTFLILTLLFIFAFFFAFFSALFLSEYLPKKNFFVFVRKINTLLLSFPTVVFGLFGVTLMSFFSPNLKLKIFICIVSLSLLVIPMLIETFIGILSEVEKSYRYTPLVFGISKIIVIFRFIIPKVLFRLIKGSFVVFLRIISESSPFLLILSTEHLILTTQIWKLNQDKNKQIFTFTFLILIIIILINIIFLLSEKFFLKRNKKN